MTSLGTPSGAWADCIPERELFMPPTWISAGSEVSQVCASHFTEPNISPTRWLVVISVAPVSIRARTRLVLPSGKGRYASITMRLWSSVMGTVTDLGVWANAGPHRRSARSVESIFMRSIVVEHLKAFNRKGRKGSREVCEAHLGIA